MQATRKCQRGAFRSMIKTLGAVAAGLLLASVAGPLPQAHAGEDGYVVAHSLFGNGSASGRVRPSRWGYEVRLPGGTWVECRRSCSETLRVSTVDIFENQDHLRGYGSLDAECGLFGCRNLLRGIR